MTLSIEDNARLPKLLSKGSKRSIYWNKYKVIPSKTYSENQYIRELLNASYRGVKRLFVLALQLIHTKNIFFQELKLKIIILKLMEEIFMLSQLMA